jgi:uncharacterized membrane protein
MIGLLLQVPLAFLLFSGILLSYQLSFNVVFDALLRRHYIGCQQSPSMTFESVASLVEWICEKKKSKNQSLPKFSTLEEYSFTGIVFVLPLAQIVSSNYYVIVFLLLLNGQCLWLAFILMPISLVLVGVHLVAFLPEWESRFGEFSHPRFLVSMGFYTMDSLICCPIALSFAGLINLVNS